MDTAQVTLEMPRRWDTSSRLLPGGMDKEGGPEVPSASSPLAQLGVSKVSLEKGGGNRITPCGGLF